MMFLTLFHKIGKTAAALLLAALMLAALPGCAGKTAGAAGKPSVVVTFNAMKEFTAAVGGNLITVRAIIPDGTEPHDYEPSARDLIGMSSADVFVYNGLGLESWAPLAVKASGNKNLIAVDASRGCSPLKSSDSDEGAYDPHLWISLKGAELEAVNIRGALIRADPAHEKEYTANCAAFTSRLEELYRRYQAKLAPAAGKSIVTGHAAFAYLCRDFGLRQSSVEDVFADDEPSARKLTQLADYCKTSHVKTVFAESMVNPAISETLASQVGAKVETIYTIESNEDGLSYLARMESNLRKIAESFQ